MELGVPAQHDVGASTGHVRRDRDGTQAPRTSDDLGLACVVFRVEDFVLDALLGEQARQVFALLDADGAHENRLAVAVPLDDVLHDLSELRLFVLIDEVRLVLADHRPVRRDVHDAQLVGRHELRRLGLGRTGHAGELFVQTEVVLQRDGGEGLVLRLDRHRLFRLDRLVDAFVVAASDEDAAGVLVDDHHLVVHHDVVGVALEQRQSLDGVVEERDQRSVDRLVQVVDAEVILDLFDTGLEHTDRALLLVDLEVDSRLEGLRDLGEFDEPAVRLALARTDPEMMKRSCAPHR